MSTSLSPSQLHAYNLIRSGKNVLITGPAGTGKSFLLKQLIRDFPDLVVTSTTGISALAVHGRTIHSWSGCGRFDMERSTLLRTLEFGKSKAAARIRSATRLAIDEISMMHGYDFEVLDDVFQTIRGSSKPFGGLQIILFGDFLQLPPIAKHHAFYPVERDKAVVFCFETLSWTGAEFQTVQLTEVFRQRDENFIGLLHRLRVGYYHPPDVEWLKALHHKSIEDSDHEPVVVLPKNRGPGSAEDYNAQKLASLDEESVFYHAEDWCASGFESELSEIDKSCLAVRDLELKVHAQVMMLTNEFFEATGLVNGSVGQVVRLDDDGPCVEWENGVKFKPERSEWTLEDRVVVDVPDGPSKIETQVVARRRQYPIKLAWANSIHKSQGMSLRCVYTDLRKIFAPGQTYVALSRAQTHEGLYVKNFTERAIWVEPKALKFYENAAQAQLLNV